MRATYSRPRFVNARSVEILADDELAYLDTINDDPKALEQFVRCLQAQKLIYELMELRRALSVAKEATAN